MSDKIDIAGISKAKVLAALYNGSSPMGMGFFRATPGDMTEEQAQEELDALAGGISSDYPMVVPQHQREIYFDYLHGRVLKTAIGGDQVDPWLYDRDNGAGAAARAIDAIKENE